MEKTKPNQDKNQVFESIDKNYTIDADYIEKREQLKRFKTLFRDLSCLKLISWTDNLRHLYNWDELKIHEDIGKIVNNAETSMQHKLRIIIADKIKDLEIELYGIKPRGEIDFEGMEMALMAELGRQGFNKILGEDFIKIIKRYL